MPQHLDYWLFKKDLPPIIWRYRWNDLAEKHGLPFRKGYMQNLDSLGLGPRRFTSRGRVAYLRDDLIEWLNGFMASDRKPTDALELGSWLDD